MANTVKTLIVNDFRGIKGERTLDFSNSDIVIFYGMNGFGKTSIFDAFEWGFTGRLGRYERYLDPGWRNNFNKEKKILRSKHAENPDAFVKIELSSGKKFGRRVIAGEDDSDYDFGSQIPGFEYGIQSLCNETLVEDFIHNHFAATHILSQETISSFVTSKKPEDRYKALSVNFGTNLFDPFDNNISRLASALTSYEKEIKTKIDAAEKNIANYKKQLNSKNADIKKVIEEANKILLELDLLSEIKLSQIVYSEDDTVAYDKASKVTIHTYKSKLEQQLLVEKENAKSFAYLNEKIAEWTKQNEKFDGLKSSVVSIKKKLDELTAISKTIHDEKQVLSQYVVEEKALSKQLAELNVIKSNVKTFYEKKIKADSLKVQIAKFNTEIDLAKKNGATFSSNALLISSELQKNIAHRDILKRLLNEIQKKQPIWDDYESKRLALQKNIASLEEQEKVLSRHQKNSEKLLNELSDSKHLLEQINSDDSPIVPLLGQDKFAQLKTSLKSREDLKITSNEVTKLLVQLNADYKKEIDKLSARKRVLEEAKSYLLHEQHISGCPVCKTAFKKDDLLAVISDQSAAGTDDRTNELRKKIDATKKLEKKNEDQVVAISSSIDGLLLFLKEAVSTLIEKDITAKKILSRQLVEASEKLRQFESENTAILSELNKAGFSLRLINKDFVEDFKLKLTLCEAEIDKLDLSSKEIKKNQDLLTKTIDNNIQLIKLQKKELETISDSEYEKINELFFSNKIENEKSANDYLNKTSLNLEKDISAITLKINSVKGKVEKLDASTVKLLNGQNILDIKKELLEKENDALRITEFLNEFSNKARGLELGPNDLNKIKIKELTERLSKKTVGTEQDLVRSNRILNYLDECRSYNENSLLRKQIEDDEKNLNSFLSKNTKARELKSKIQGIKNQFPQIIKEYIERNLDPVLFNDIYRSLNPHTRFQKMDFDVNIRNNQVGISFEAKDGAVRARPEYLFSSAQLNTFGVSMFLSVALRQKWLNLDVMLLDDPIQNLDDINILSFIDFLRSLLDSTHNKKQIILSTHDERFYDLLIKKFEGYRLKKFRFISYGVYEED